jgi:hypothetical protein
LEDATSAESDREEGSSRAERVVNRPVLPRSRLETRSTPSTPGGFESGELHAGTSGAEKSRDPETESTQSSLRPPSLLVISLGVLGVLGV